MNLNYLYLDESSLDFNDLLNNILLTNFEMKKSFDKNVDNYYNVRMVIF